MTIDFYTIISNTFQLIANSMMFHYLGAEVVLFNILFLIALYKVCDLIKWEGDRA